jgi:hypothetical protein
MILDHTTSCSVPSVLITIPPSPVQPVYWRVVHRRLECRTPLYLFVLHCVDHAIGQDGFGSRDCRSLIGLESLADRWCKCWSCGWLVLAQVGIHLLYRLQHNDFGSAVVTTHAHVLSLCLPVCLPVCLFMRNYKAIRIYSSITLLFTSALHPFSSVCCVVQCCSSSSIACIQRWNTCKLYQACRCTCAHSGSRCNVFRTC